MDLPEPLRFAPVPTRARHDGWSADDQRRFILHLSRGALVDEAARALGHSRQSAYALRRRKDAEEFALAWDRDKAALRLLAEADRCEQEWNLSKLTR